ncbi:MAG TPA: SLC13 family permease [Vicinamibacterales bacterium]|nr:SLC13 family permease [Vicinamibacterales bacterium]
MLAPVIAIAIFIVIFAVATARDIHLGILMFPAACLAGVTLAGMPLRDVIGGFPVGILVLLAGVTYFFGIAHVNGTTDRVVRALLARIGKRPMLLPFVFFALSAAVAAMGSPQGGFVLAPIGMPVARRSGVHSAVMAVAINSGISAGGFAPTSLFGIVSYQISRRAGIGLTPLTLLTVSVVVNLLLVVAALAIFGRGEAGGPDAGGALDNPDASSASGLSPVHVLTLACMAGLVLSVIACALAGLEPDVGVIAFVFGALLTLIAPAIGGPAFQRIDWSTAFAVGGIVTFVGVLQKLGSVDLLGHGAMTIGTPLLAATVVCMIAGLASAFASTTGILAALVPLAVPLAQSGAVPGWALICALGVCASIVDISPFSTTGATLIASAAEGDRPRLRQLLLRWGLSMIVAGPIVLVPLLAMAGWW